MDAVAKKLIFPLCLLTMPYWLGLPLIMLGINSAGFILAAIMPQVITNPFSSYYDSQTNEVLSASPIPAIVFWTFVLIIYLYITKAKSQVASAIMFIFIMFIAVMLMHFCFKTIGYSLVIDSI